MSNIISLLAKSAPALARQGLSRILPTGEERVIRGLRAYGDRFFDPANAQGLTVDPRTGRNIEVGKEIGNMMSRIPNPPNNANVVRNVDDLVNYVQSNPAVMREMRTGGYAGGWYDQAAGGLVFDPSRRYLTRGGAMRAGMDSNQKAGFDLARVEEFPVTPPATRQIAAPVIGQAGGAALGALGGGAGSAAMLSQDGELSGTDLLGVLGGAAAGALAGKGNAARSGAWLQRGVMDRRSLEKVRKLGVAEMPDRGIGQSAAVARDRARALGVPEEKLAKIKDTDSEKTAFTKAYEYALEKYGSMFNKVTGPKLKQAKADMLAKAGSVVVPYSSRLDDSLRLKFGGKVSTDKNFDNVVDDVISLEVSPVFEGMGLRPVRHIKTVKAADDSVRKVPTDQLAKLAKNGEVNKLSEASEDIIHNLSRFVTEEDLADIAARNGAPVFYIIHNLGTRARAAAAKTPLLRMLAAQGPASARNAPVPEVTLGQGALISRQTDDLVKSGLLSEAPKYPDWRNYVEEPLDGLKVGSEKYKAIEKAAKNNPEYKRLVKERSTAISEGALVNTGQMAKNPLKSLEVVQNDIVSFFRNPLSVPNIAEKVWTYFGTVGNPFQKLVSTMDSWMMRAAFGQPKLGTATPGSASNISLEYQLVHEAMNELAKRLKVPPAALQEVIWKNVRIVSEQAGESFKGLGSREWNYPFLSATAKEVPEGMPSFIEMSKSKEFVQSNKNFINNIINAIQENPETAKYVRIVGDDLEFTDEFFKAIQLF